MSYENPQRVINKTWEIFARMTQANNNAIVNSLSDQIDYSIQQRKINKKELDQLEYSKNQYAFKLDSVDTSDSGKMFDDNLRMYYDDQIQKYYDIKNGMRKGEIDKREGNKILNNMMLNAEKMGTYIPEILKIANEVYESAGTAGEENGISTATTPKEVITIFSSIAQGGNVYTVEDPKTGNVWLMKLPEDAEKKYMSDGTISNDELLRSFNVAETNKDGSVYNQELGAKNQGALVNLDELLKDGGAKGAVKRITPISAYQAKFNEAPEIMDMNNYNNGYYIVSETYEVDETGDYSTTSTKVTMDANSTNKMQKDQLEINAYTTLLDDKNAMNSVWRDIMGEDTDYFTESNEKNEENRNKARLYLINSGIQKQLLRRGLIQGKEIDGKFVAVDKEGKALDLDLSAEDYFTKLQEKGGFSSIDEMKVVNRDRVELNKTTVEEESVLNSNRDVINNIYGKVREYANDAATPRTDGKLDKENFAIQVVDMINSGEGNQFNRISGINPDKPGVVKIGKSEFDLFDDKGEVKEGLLMQLIAYRAGVGLKTSAKAFKYLSKDKFNDNNSYDLP